MRSLFCRPFYVRCRDGRALSMTNVVEHYREPDVLQPVEELARSVIEMANMRGAAGQQQVLQWCVSIGTHGRDRDYEPYPATRPRQVKTPLIEKGVELPTA